jgi:AbrB family looped-hinge helix DNA binding protein
MVVAKVSTKGGVVIPAGIRKQLGILPGCNVAVMQMDGAVRIVLLPDDPVRSLKGCLITKKSAGGLLQETRKQESLHEDALMKRSS